MIVKTRLAELEAELTPLFEKVCLKGQGTSSFLYVVNKGRAVEISEDNGGFWLEFWEKGDDEDAGPVTELSVEDGGHAIQKSRDWLYSSAKDERMTSHRPKIPAGIETEVLVKSGRRCALCFGLRGEDSEKPGQIAHLDHNRSNNDFGNLCFLCQPHHDQYDSSTSQTKGLTEREVRVYRDTLYAALPQIINSNTSKAGSIFVSSDIAAGTGNVGPGGNVQLEGGIGRNGADGGDVMIGPGNYRAGDGGPGGGKGGDLVIKGGDAK
jgi:hypothetical protein